MQCAPVPPGTWSALGSALPTPCPTSGYYCPGALADAERNGSAPLLVRVGATTATEVVQTERVRLAFNLTRASAADGLAWIARAVPHADARVVAHDGTSPASRARRARQGMGRTQHNELMT